VETCGVVALGLIRRLAWLADRFGVDRVACILIDEAEVQVSGWKAWVWLAFEPHRRAFLGFHLNWASNSLDA
jgi:hypothetical protein